MAERALRGPGLGATSYETGRNHDLIAAAQERLARQSRLGRRRRPSRFAIPHCATRQSASATTERLILLAPFVRSVNVIGTSRIVKPCSAVRSVKSTWKQ